MTSNLKKMLKQELAIVWLTSDDKKFLCIDDALNYEEKLEKKLIKAEKNGTLPKIVVAVHFAGQSCEMTKIYALSKKYNFNIIEDASHAIGGKYKNKLIGNCLYSDITVFSFHPVKIITSGEGGAALTNNGHLAKRMNMFRTHGIINNLEEMKERPNDELWNYQQVDIGFNYRMTDIQAALVNNQLKRVDNFVESRNIHANYYQKAISNLPITSQKINKNSPKGHF